MELAAHASHRSAPRPLFAGSERVGHCMLAEHFRPAFAAVDVVLPACTSDCAKRSMPNRIVPRKLMCPKWAGPMRRSQLSSMRTPLRRSRSTVSCIWLVFQARTRCWSVARENLRPSASCPGATTVSRRQRTLQALTTHAPVQKSGQRLFQLDAAICRGCLPAYEVGLHS